ncbi:hypothetical protein OAO87_04030 [bacterium]|nr:hypothetical protein [bacterium]
MPGPREAAVVLANAITLVAVGSPIPVPALATRLRCAAVACTWDLTTACAAAAALLNPNPPACRGPARCGMMAPRPSSTTSARTASRGTGGPR